MLRAKTHLHSLGFLSQQMQKSPQTLEKVLDKLGIAPEVKQNSIGYYDEVAYAALSDYFEEKEERK
jgi:hypothetical protein